MGLLSRKLRTALQLAKDEQNSVCQRCKKSHSFLVSAKEEDGSKTANLREFSSSLRIFGLFDTIKNAR